MIKPEFREGRLRLDDTRYLEDLATPEACSEVEEELFVAEGRILSQLEFPDRSSREDGWERRARSALRFVRMAQASVRERRADLRAAQRVRNHEMSLAFEREKCKRLAKIFRDLYPDDYRRHAVEIEAEV